MKKMFCQRARTANKANDVVVNTHSIIACAVDALKHNETMFIETPLNPTQLRFVLKKTLKRARVKAADCAVEYAVGDDGYTQLVTITKIGKEQEKAA